MIYLTIYLITAMVVLHADALACVSTGHSYNIRGSLVAALLWPISVPVTICQVWKEVGK